MFDGRGSSWNWSRAVAATGTAVSRHCIAHCHLSSLDYGTIVLYYIASLPVGALLLLANLTRVLLGKAMCSACANGHQRPSNFYGPQHARTGKPVKNMFASLFLTNNCPTVSGIEASLKFLFNE